MYINTASSRCCVEFERLWGLQRLQLLQTLHCLKDYVAFIYMIESGRTQWWRISPAQRPAVNPRHDDTLSEKLFHLCITFLTQRFEQGDDRQTPLMHFSSVLGIDLKSSKFREPRTYTPILAGLIWVRRLLLLEYALPNREYRSLQWPSREAYHDHGWRLEELRRAHSIEGSYSPMSHLVGLLASVEELLDDMLLFGMNRPRIDLKSLEDMMTKDECGFSIMQKPLNRLGEGYRLMLSLMKLATQNKRLLKDDDEWEMTNGDRKRALEYLDKKRWFLELLMLAMHLTGGQPAREPELGWSSFEIAHSLYGISSSSVGMRFTLRSITKPERQLNSYFVVRYLARSWSSSTSPTFARSAIPSSIKSASERIHRMGTLFCSEESNDKCWDGKKLTEIMQRESGARSGSKINISKYRHIAVAVTRVHVKEIAGHFAKDDAVWQEMLSQNKDFNVYAWQTGHQRAMNNSTYGLDQAYPCHLQPELLSEYRRISQLWHIWLGFDDDGNITATHSRKRTHADENGVMVVEKGIVKERTSQLHRREGKKRSWQKIFLLPLIDWWRCEPIWQILLNLGRMRRFLGRDLVCNKSSILIRWCHSMGNNSFFISFKSYIVKFMLPWTTIVVDGEAFSSEIWMVQRRNWREKEFIQE